MSLEDYQKKRNFSSTPEPAKKGIARRKASDFVVQRHQARQLHYDFRLEADGVLKSWAVPKGPSMNPADKRLAMQVEDHPRGYKRFAGTIPAGNYGAGTVEIWDHGKYTPLDQEKRPCGETEFLKQLKAGNARFVLQGNKLKGEFALIRMKSLKEAAWLLIKMEDEFAVHEPQGPVGLSGQALPLKKTRKKPGK